MLLAMVSGWDNDSVTNYPVMRSGHCAAWHVTTMSRDDMSRGCGHVTCAANPQLVNSSYSNFRCPLPPLHHTVIELETNLCGVWSFTITEKAPWLKTPTGAFTSKTILRNYAKQALTPRSLYVKLGPWRNYPKGRAAIRHYANQPARPFRFLCREPNFTLRDRGVNARLA